MRVLPIDTTDLDFILLGEVRPKEQYGGPKGQQKTDRHGRPEWVLRVVGPDGDEPMNVTVPAQMKPSLGHGEKVRFTGLVVGFTSGTRWLRAETVTGAAE